MTTEQAEGAAEFSDLGDALGARRVAEDRFDAEIHEGWQQGRGAFGGLVLGMLGRAMEEVLADPGRLLRSLTGELCGPVMPGAAELRVELLRAGSAMTTLAARLVQGAEVQAHAVAVFGKARVKDRETLLVSPPAPPPCESVHVAPVRPPLGPVFARHFEFRPTGPLPFTGATEASTSGWIRPHRARRDLGGCELIAVVDTWWPCALALETAPRPMATVAFTAQLHATTPHPAARALFYRARSLAAHDGFVSEQRELWDEGGRLLLLNHQTFVYVR